MARWPRLEWRLWSFRTQYWCLCYGLVLFVIVLYKEKKIREINDKFIFFFKNRQKLVKVKIGLLFTTRKPYLVTNLQENLILERKLVILSRRRKRKIKQ